jgi:succinate dehydrogenase/fumarate reductase-like Fe-S protein
VRFTAAQYDAAIEALVAAKGQLEPDAQCCRICHDTGHQAWECGHNPLYAMHVCEDLVPDASKLHEELHAIEEKLSVTDRPAALEDWREKAHTLLHYLAGFDQWMGRRVGPARVVLPQEEIAA